MSNFEYSEMRKKLNKAHSEIIHSRQYRGARESDVVSWLADYVENNFIATSAYQALQKENEELKDQLEQREGTCQNLFERWQNSMAREIQLEARIGVMENCLERFLSHSRECADDFNNTFEDLCSDTRKALKEGLDDSL